MGPWGAGLLGRGESGLGWRPCPPSRGLHWSISQACVLGLVWGARWGEGPSGILLGTRLTINTQPSHFEVNHKVPGTVSALGNSWEFVPGMEVGV